MEERRSTLSVRRSSDFKYSDIQPASRIEPEFTAMHQQRACSMASAPGGRFARSGIRAHSAAICKSAHCQCFLGGSVRVNSVTAGSLTIDRAGVTAQRSSSLACLSRKLKV